MATYDLKLKKILRDNGCKLERQASGSHEVWYSPVNGNRFTIPKGIKSRHMANEILKQAGIEKEF